MAYTSDKELWATADGRIVEHGDPAGATVLVGAGGTIPDDVAAKYGLKPNTDAVAEARKQEEANRATVVSARIDKPYDVIITAEGRALTLDAEPAAEPETDEKAVSEPPANKAVSNKAQKTK